MDAVSTVEAQMLCRLETLDKKVILYRKMSERGVFLNLANTHLSSNLAPVTPGPAPRPDNTGAQMMSLTVLQDASVFSLFGKTISTI